MNVGSLKTEGMVTVPYPDKLRPVITRAVESWQTFCTLDSSTKNNFIFETYGGYELK